MWLIPRLLDSLTPIPPSHVCLIDRYVLSIPRTTTREFEMVARNIFKFPTQLRPFPAQLNIGTDIVHVNRIREILVRNSTKPGYLDRFLRRFLTLRERYEFDEIRNGLTADMWDAESRYLAGRCVFSRLNAIHVSPLGV